jgi:hypothetical protein
LEPLHGPEEDDSGAAVDLVTRELQVRADPNRVALPTSLPASWTRAGRARGTAEDLALTARLDIFRDDLRAIRIAYQVLSRAATMRAVEAAETAIFEIRTVGEIARFAILNRSHLEMTRQFLEHLELLEAFRGRLTSEIVDALKERALNEFTTRMNRASRSDVEFARNDILKLRT